VEQRPLKVIGGDLAGLVLPVDERLLHHGVTVQVRRPEPRPAVVPDTLERLDALEFRASIVELKVHQVSGPYGFREWFLTPATYSHEESLRELIGGYRGTQALDRRPS